MIISIIIINNKNDDNTMLSHNLLRTTFKVSVQGRVVEASVCAFQCFFVRFCNYLFALFYNNQYF